MAAIQNYVQIGSNLWFENGDSTNRYSDCIVSINWVPTVSVSGDRLAIDELTLVVKYGQPPWPAIPRRRYVYQSPDGSIYLSPGDEIYYTLESRFIPGVIPPPMELPTIPYGTQLTWEIDDGNGREIVAQYYVDSVERVGKYLYKIKAISGVGLLDKIDHVGGIYTGQSFETVAIEIINSAFPFTVTEALASQEIYGWLPYDTARNNLHRLLVAMGASIRRDETGTPLLCFLRMGNGKNIEPERIDVNLSMNYQQPCTRFEVTEHAYADRGTSDEEVTLFDNTAGGAASHSLVKFSAPMHNLTASGGLSIDSGSGNQGVNFAYVTGTGVLKGRQYAHTERIVAEDAVSPDGRTNVKSLRSDFTLISLANSLNVARRLLDYVDGARTISARLKLEGERCGDVLRLPTWFYPAHSSPDSPIVGFLESADINVSSTMVGRCKLIEGFTPDHQGNNVTGYAELSGSGTWTSPFTGSLTVTVISGGQGGSPGHQGSPGTMPSASSASNSVIGGEAYNAKFVRPLSAKSGAGGKAGANPGSGGRIYMTTISVTAGQVISYSCGTGGAGAAYTGTSADDTALGALGTDTTFGMVSSASGTTSSSGYIDPITGDVIAMSGDTGVDGGAGVGFEADESTGLPIIVSPEAIIVGAIQYIAGSKGVDASAGPAQHGNNGKYYAVAIGGYGGGPAYGANGSAGGAGQAETYSSAYCAPGKGGDGATALPPPDASVYGKGGTSGNGGGGGGAVGTSYKEGYDPDAYLAAGSFAENRWNTTTQTGGTVTLTMPAASQGGAGSNGGKGGDGCIRLYWGGN